MPEKVDDPITTPLGFDDLPEELRAILESEPETENQPEPLLMGRYKTVNEVVEHAKHFQSESDRQRVRADQLETELAQTRAQLRDPKEVAREVLKTDEGRRLAAAMIGSALPPTEGDPFDLFRPDTTSHAWLQQQVQLKIDAALKPVVEQLASVQAETKQRTELEKLLAAHPELMDSEHGEERRKAFLEDLKRRQEPTLEDRYRLHLIDSGGTPGAGNRPPGSTVVLPRGAGEVPARGPVELTEDEKSALRLLALGQPRRSEFI